MCRESSQCEGDGAVSGVEEKVKGVLSMEELSVGSTPS